MKYLDWLEKLKVIPNFWCSEEYFEKAHLEEELLPGNFLIVKDSLFKGTGMILVPAVDIEYGTILPGGVPRIWSDFEGWQSVSYSPSFLDYEYIYNPKEFLTMDGGKWQVFRKNCRKFPKRVMTDLTYNRLGAWNYPNLDGAFNEMFQEWLSGADREIQDDEVMLKYFGGGENRKILWSRDERKIYGVNIWDENYHYVNFRYSFCRKDDYLPEYMRWLFYTDGEIVRKNKLVNDGGTLDNPNLKRFKDKLCPCSVREVHSWLKNFS
jgi:hypothetical protein